MCKLKKYHNTSNTLIDKCIRNLIENLDYYLNPNAEVVACCCGHGKYPMTILVRQTNPANDRFTIFDWVSNVRIPRARNFYKRDKQGYYYIPEVQGEKSIIGREGNLKKAIAYGVERDLTVMHDKTITLDLTVFRKCLLIAMGDDKNAN